VPVIKTYEQPRIRPLKEQLYMGEGGEGNERGQRGFLRTENIWLFGLWASKERSNDLSADAVVKEALNRERR